MLAVMRFGSIRIGITIRCSFDRIGALSDRGSLTAVVREIGGLLAASGRVRGFQHVLRRSIRRTPP